MDPPVFSWTEAMAETRDAPQSPASATTSVSAVLTYFTENTLSKTAFQSKPSGEPIPDSDRGKWIGVSRVYLTPYALTTSRIVALDNDTGFDTTQPLQVKVLSVTFSLSTATLPVGREMDAVGPVVATLAGIPATVAVLTPADVVARALTQEAGDSISVRRESEMSESASGEKEACFFCGAGFTTRLGAAGIKTPAALERPRRTPWISAGVTATLPPTSHILTLKGVEGEIGGTMTTNSYAIEKSDLQARIASRESVLAFQNAQAECLLSGKKADLPISVPLWGALQIEVPAEYLKGACLAATATDATVGVLNTAVELLVRVPVMA